MGRNGRTDPSAIMFYLKEGLDKPQSRTHTAVLTKAGSSAACAARGVGTMTTADGDVVDITI
jgi:hypothetical protein